MNLASFISDKVSRSSDGSLSSNIQKVAVISISTAVFSLLMSYMILSGFKEKITEKIFSFSGHLIVSKYSLGNNLDEAFELDSILIDQLNRENYVDRWQSVAYKAGLLKANDEIQGVLIKGVDHTFDSAYFSTNLIEGSFPKISGNSYGTEVAISKKISNSLNVSVGENMIIFFAQNPPRFRNLTISGIYETGMEDFDDKLILGDIRLIRRINNWAEDQIGAIEVFTESTVSLEFAHEELFMALDSDLYVESVSEKYLQLFDWLGLLNRNVLILWILILVVASFSMVSILLILIMDRTQMIGLLKAMGAENSLIRRIFIKTGFDLILKGLIYGNVLALAIGILQAKFHIIPLDPVNYYMSYVPIKFDLYISILMNLLILLLIGLSLLIPVGVISRILPIRSIRFD